MLFDFITTMSYPNKFLSIYVSLMFYYQILLKTVVKPSYKFVFEERVFNFWSEIFDGAKYVKSDDIFYVDELLVVRFIVSLVDGS